MLRYRTESHQDVVNRFNERFILSLASNHSGTSPLSIEDIFDKPNCSVTDPDRGSDAFFDPGIRDG
jgi:hypothetical protein